MSRCDDAVSVSVKTQGSDAHWVKPYCSSHGKSVRCHRRPACAMLYTGFSTRQIEADHRRRRS
eukprot:149142-Pleurochrysis_carterae.AAC.1